MDRQAEGCIEVELASEAGAGSSQGTLLGSDTAGPSLSSLLRKVWLSPVLGPIAGAMAGAEVQPEALQPCGLHLPPPQGSRWTAPPWCPPSWPRWRSSGPRTSGRDGTAGC